MKLILQPIYIFRARRKKYKTYRLSIISNKIIFSALVYNKFNLKSNLIKYYR